MNFQEFNVPVYLIIDIKIIATDLNTFFPKIKFQKQCIYTHYTAINFPILKIDIIL